MMTRLEAGSPLWFPACREVIVLFGCCCLLARRLVERGVRFVPVRDLYVTILRLLGLDDSKLTYCQGGRFKQLSQTGGSVIRKLL